jgi:hypothetical protein
MSGRYRGGGGGGVQKTVTPTTITSLQQQQQQQQRRTIDLGRAALINGLLELTSTRSWSLVRDIILIISDYYSQYLPHLIAISCPSRQKHNDDSPTGDEYEQYDHDADKADDDDINPSPGIWVASLQPIQTYHEMDHKDVINNNNEPRRINDGTDINLEWLECSSNLPFTKLLYVTIINDHIFGNQQQHTHCTHSRPIIPKLHTIHINQKRGFII